MDDPSLGLQPSPQVRWLDPLAPTPTISSEGGPGALGLKQKNTYVQNVMVLLLGLSSLTLFSVCFQRSFGFL